MIKKSLRAYITLRKMVFNYLHLCRDSRYKSSIDNGPIYSIIDPTNAQMGKSNAGYLLFRELPGDARQQADHVRNPPGAAC